MLNQTHEVREVAGASDCWQIIRIKVLLWWVTQKQIGCHNLDDITIPASWILKYVEQNTMHLSYSLRIT